MDILRIDLGIFKSILSTLVLQSSSRVNPGTRRRCKIIGAICLLRTCAWLIVLKGLLLLVVAQVCAVILDLMLKLRLILWTSRAQSIYQPLLPMNYKALRQIILLFQVLLWELLGVGATYIIYGSDFPSIVRGLSGLLLWVNSVAHIAFWATISDRV